MLYSSNLYTLDGCIMYMYLYDESASDLPLVLLGNAVWNAPMRNDVSQVGM